jgi:hypothetical protein
MRESSKVYTMTSSDLLSSPQDRDPSTIAQNFFDFRPRFGRYHFYFGFCEFLNLVMILLSVVITDALLLNKFWT